MKAKTGVRKVVVLCEIRNSGMKIVDMSLLSAFRKPAGVITTISVNLGSDYESLDYRQALDFLLMTVNSLRSDREL